MNQMPSSDKSSGLEAIGRELKENPPKILAHTAKKFGKGDANRQRTAIMLSKARRAGLSVPSIKGRLYSQ